MKILVLNCGSSSVKFQLIDTDREKIKNQEEIILAKGVVERIGLKPAYLHYTLGKGQWSNETLNIENHQQSLEKIATLLSSPGQGVIKNTAEIEAVGHRVVHGGERFATSVLVSPEVLVEVERCSLLSPLHNPHNLKGYQAAKVLFKDQPQVFVFDTGFHQTVPPEAYLYALPWGLAQKHRIRRYGFHGTSHRYVVSRLGKILDRSPRDFRIVSCHLGNGCSLTAVKYGYSIDTTMGFTPLEGLVMGTRCGDLDPAIVLYLEEKENLSPKDMDNLLNRKSGLLGLSGISADLRELLKARQEGNERARLALAVFTYRLKKYIAGYAGAMGGIDFIIFTAGIGENSPAIRVESLAGLEFLGLRIDTEMNNQLVGGQEGFFSPADSVVKAAVIPTNEELLIARDTYFAIRSQS